MSATHNIGCGKCGSRVLISVGDDGMASCPGCDRVYRASVSETAAYVSSITFVGEAMRQHTVEMPLAEFDRYRILVEPIIVGGQTACIGPDGTVSELENL